MDRKTRRRPDTHSIPLLTLPPPTHTRSEEGCTRTTRHAHPTPTPPLSVHDTTATPNAFTVLVGVVLGEVGLEDGVGLRVLHRDLERLYY